MTDKKMQSKKQIEDLEDKYKRAAADYQNLKRRSEEEKGKIIRLANERLILNMLEVLDDLEESLKHIDDKDGVEKVIDKFRNKLKLEGLEEINPKGSDFNPYEHEALDSVEGEEGKIINVYRKGYKLFDKVVRPAFVAVGNGQESKIVNKI
jgi:molecular chaperone GrpE